MNGQLDLTWVDPRLESLRRDETSGFGTGLSRALAQALGIDVSLVRVGFVLLALAGGFGLPLYIWGTALSANPDGARPIDSSLPGFGEWGIRTQQAAVALTTVLATALLAPITPLPWGLGVLGVALLWLAGRGKLGVPPPRSDGAPAGSAAEWSDSELVEQWRSTMTAAAGPPARLGHLPVVDLYSPAPEPGRLPNQRPPAAWLSGLGIVGVSLAAGVIAVALGSGPLVAVGSALMTAALLTLVFALTVRSRRVPRPLLFLLGLAMVPAGWLATQSSTAAQVVPPSSNTLVERVVAEDRTITLTEADLEGIDVVQIDAIASNLTIELPGPPAHSGSTETLSRVTYAGGVDAPALDIELVVNATASNVEVEYP